jgi:hypothetical protein
MAAKFSWVSGSTTRQNLISGSKQSGRIETPMILFVLGGHLFESSTMLSNAYLVPLDSGSLTFKRPNLSFKPTPFGAA